MSNKLIVKNSIFLYIRLIATTIIGLLTSRYTLAALGVENFGLYSVVAGVVGMMAFVNTIMVSATYRFIALEIGKKKGDINKAFNISLTIHLVISAIVVILAFTVGLFYVKNYMKLPEGRLEDAIFVFSFAILNTVCMIIGTPFQGLLVAKEKFSITVPIEIFSKGLTLVLVIVLGFLPGNRLIIYSIFVTIAHMLNPLLYILYSFKSYYKEIKPKFYRDRGRYLEMIKFSGWMAVGAGASMLEHSGSALIINRFFGTILNASFGIANQVRTLASMFTRSIGQAVIPQITKSYGADNQARSKKLVSFSSKYSFFFMLIPLLPIMMEIDFMLHIWLTVVPDFTTSFVRIMLIQSLIRSISSGIPTLIQASGKVGYFTIFTSITMLLCLPLAYFLFSMGYPPYSISYIYATTALLNLIVTIVLLKLILHYDVGFFLKEVILKDVLVLLIVMPAFVIPFLMNQGWLRLMVSTLVGEALLIGAIYFVGMDEKERKMMHDALGSGYAKVKGMMGKREGFAG